MNFYNDAVSEYDPKGYHKSELNSKNTSLAQGTFSLENNTKLLSQTGAYGGKIEESELSDISHQIDNSVVFNTDKPKPESYSSINRANHPQL